jgi:SPP1 gp7 family putative phage head morphogenesis protein
VSRFLDANEELDLLLDNNADAFEVAFNEVIAGVVNDSRQQVRRGQAEMSRVFRQSNQMADLMGRRRAILEARAEEDTSVLASAYGLCYDGFVGYSEDDLPFIRTVDFTEGIKDLLSRTPELAETAELVAAVYNERHGFAMALSTSEAITERVQKFMAESRRRGVPERDATRIIAAMGDFTRAYARVVYRTNLNSAYTAGRLQQAADPDIQAVMAAWQYVAIQDSRVRRGLKADSYGAGEENHLAMNGMVAPLKWQGWNTYATPNGYNCRCTMIMRSKAKLRREGLFADGAAQMKLPPGLSPEWVHPNFRGRPDAGLYGTTG